MTDLIFALGQNLSDPLSNVVVYQSDDGVSWTNPTTPFSRYQSASSISYGLVDSVPTLITISSVGNVAVSTNFINWEITTQLEGGYFSPLSIDYGNSIFATCGFNKNNSSFNETAIIFHSADGSTWNNSYTNSISPSILYSIKYINAMWVAVGQSNNTPLVIYSTDAVNWAVLDVPDEFNDFIFYDVDYFNNYYYFSSNSYIVNNLNLSTTWGASAKLESDYSNTNFTKIGINSNGQAVAVSSGAIYSSTDLTTWNKFQYPGYAFISVAYFNNNWLVGSYSTLNQFTLFTSTNGIAWSASNNGVQTIEFVSNYIPVTPTPPVPVSNITIVSSPPAVSVNSIFGVTGNIKNVSDQVLVFVSSSDTSSLFISDLIGLDSTPAIPYSSGNWIEPKVTLFEGSVGPAYIVAIDYTQFAANGGTTLTGVDYAVTPINIISTPTPYFVISIYNTANVNQTPFYYAGFAQNYLVQMYNTTFAQTSAGLSTTPSLEGLLQNQTSDSYTPFAVNPQGIISATVITTPPTAGTYYVVVWVTDNPLYFSASAALVVTENDSGGNALSSIASQSNPPMFSNWGVNEKNLAAGPYPTTLAVEPAAILLPGESYQSGNMYIYPALAESTGLVAPTGPVPIVNAYWTNFSPTTTEPTPDNSTTYLMATSDSTSPFFAFALLAFPDQYTVVTSHFSGSIRTLFADLPAPPTAGTWYLSYWLNNSSGENIAWCVFEPFNVTAPNVLFITSTTGEYTLPSDFSGTSPWTIEMIGAGGGSTFSINPAGAGGGGGAYSKISSSDGYSLSANQTIYVNVGLATDSWVNFSANSPPTARYEGALAKAGANAIGTTGGVGGQASESIGTIVYSGGNGGDCTDNYGLGGGGGGSAGPNGNGQNGGSGGNTSGTGGGGGGGANGGLSTAGGSSTSSTGGLGGLGPTGSGPAQPGVNGTNGGGGGGSSSSGFTYAGNGGSQNVWVQTSDGSIAGPGGGGAAFYIGISNTLRGAGGNYGGGSGGGGYADVTINGAPGIIVITYK
jgi:hypothetical protein